VPGDHDHKVDIGLYQKYMEPTLYQSFNAAGYHFVFLDVMAGISSDEQSWLQSDLASASAQGRKSVLFMHSYGYAYQLQSLIQKYNVLMLDTGHTHTNQMANDGHTIYAATRSTGQISEGPVGFSITNIDNGVISWKFKPLGSWPFVMITSPSDKGLMTSGSQVVHGIETVRAKIWDDKGVASATYHVDNGQSYALTRIGSTQMWNATFNSTKLSSGAHTITVNVRGAGGNTSQDTINVLVNQSGSTTLASRSFGPLNNSLGVYTEKGLLGTASGGGPGGKGGPGGAGGRGHGACASTSTSGSATPTATPTPSASRSSSGTASTRPAGPCGGPGGKGGKHGHGGLGGPGGPGGSTGTITGVSGNRLTVRESDGSTEQVLVGSGTQVTKMVSGSTSDLKAGETISMRGAPGAATSGGAVTASQIYIQPSSRS